MVGAGEELRYGRLELGVMRETRFPIHVPENVPGTKVQEHDWEIACASVSSVSRPCGR